MINPFAAPIAIVSAKVFAGVAAAAIGVAAVQTVRIEGALCRSAKVGEKPACIVQGFKQQLVAVRIDLELVRALRLAERASHQTTKANYRAAQAEAARLEAARLARAAAQQKEISDDRAESYERRIAAARAAAERLRRGTGGAAGSGAAGAAAGFAMPAFPDAAGEPDGAAGDRRLSRSERLVATEQAVRLDELQRWIRDQVAIDPNAP